MHLPGNIINLEALLYALAQQSEPLPEWLQRSFAKIGQAVQLDPTEADATELRQIIKSYDPLEIAYQKGLVESDRRYVSQERTKSLGSTFPTTARLEDLFSNRVLCSSDWTISAKQLTKDLNSQENPSQFWDKADRIAVMTAGGAALGGAVAQIPGAIIGGLIAAGYGWYIGFGQAKPSRDL